MKPKTVRVSTANTAFQRLEALKRNRQKRHRHRRFLVEGVRSIDLLLAKGWTVEAFAYAPERTLSRWAEDILARSRAGSHLELSLDLLGQLSEKEATSELIAVVETRDADLSSLTPGPRSLIVVADRPASPGNLGTLFRSCDSFGADALVVTGHATDPYDPQTVRASVGALFTVPFVVLPSHRELLQWTSEARRRAAGLQLVGTSASATTPLRSSDLTRPTVILIGNEAAGLSHAYQAACDVMVGIPMRGSSSSLNMAVAASIALYEADAQRRATPR